MNDTDYIRKAVELADGWKLRHQEWGYDICGPMPLGAYALCDEIDQPVLDALAAQLVRQVDALPDLKVCTTIEYSCVVRDFFDGNMRLGQHTQEVIGKDRTMNTIKAIVDSGVLDREGQ